MSTEPKREPGRIRKEDEGEGLREASGSAPEQDKTVRLCARIMFLSSCALGLSFLGFVGGIQDVLGSLACSSARLLVFWLGLGQGGCLLVGRGKEGPGFVKRGDRTALSNV